MLIKKQEFTAFKDFCRGYFKVEREAKSVQVAEGLKVKDRKLYRAIEKTVGKKKMIGYVGRLLRSVRLEGWLVYENKVWRTRPEWGYCTFCFTPLDELYLIDINHDPYCNSDCFDEHEAVGHYDGYADDYMFLFWEVEKLRDSYQYYLERPLRKSFRTNLELLMILQDIYRVLNDSDYSTVLYNGGDDGPLASEMYRMLMMVSDAAEKLEAMQKQCESVLPETNQFFSIEIGEEIMRKRKQPEILREFIQTHRKYRDKENSNKWSTTDSMQRSNWYDELVEDAELKGNIALLNEVKCPQCEKIIDKDSSRRAPDGYFYCQDCYGELDFEYEFRRG